MIDKTNTTTGKIPQIQKQALQKMVLVRDSLTSSMLVFLDFVMHPCTNWYMKSQLNKCTH